MPILAPKKLRRTSPRNPPPVKEMCPLCNELVNIEDSEQHANLKHNTSRCKKCRDYYRLDWLPHHEKDFCPADIPDIDITFPLFSAPPRGGTNSASKSRKFSHFFIFPIFFAFFPFFQFSHFLIFPFFQFSHFFCSQLLDWNQNQLLRIRIRIPPLRGRMHGTDSAESTETRNRLGRVHGNSPTRIGSLLRAESTETRNRLGTVHGNSPTRIGSLLRAQLTQ